jgi:hypothetical protein
MHIFEDNWGQSGHLYQNLSIIPVSQIVIVP